MQRKQKKNYFQIIMEIIAKSIKKKLWNKYDQYKKKNIGFIYTAVLLIFFLISDLFYNENHASAHKLT
jgi:F0F1-type ATP synthase membrane subunit a